MKVIAYQSFIIRDLLYNFCLLMLFIRRGRTINYVTNNFTRIMFILQVEDYFNTVIALYNIHNYTAAAEAEQL